MNQANRPPAAPPSRWQSRETWIVLALVLGFLLLGLRTYRERRVIAQSDRMKEDMQLFAFAINTFRNEEGAYPLPEGNAEGFGAFLPVSLTTPVAYATHLLTDPFQPESDRHEVLRYLRRRDEGTTAGESDFDAFVREQIGGPVEDVDYVFWSRGPDGDLDTQRLPEMKINSVRYDPTNGARSNGDLFFWGPAIGVRRNPYLGTAAAGPEPLQ